MARLVQVMLLAPTAQSCNEAQCFIRLYLLLLYVVLCRKMVGRQAGRQDWCWKFMALSMTSFILVQCCVTKPSRVVVRWWWWRWWWWWWDDADDCPDFGVVSLEMTFTAPSIHPIIHPCIHASFHPSIHPSNSHVLDAYVNASCTMHRFQHYYQTHFHYRK